MFIIIRNISPSRPTSHADAALICRNLIDELCAFLELLVSAMLKKVDSPS